MKIQSLSLIVTSLFAVSTAQAVDWYTNAGSHKLSRFHDIEAASSTRVTTVSDPKSQQGTVYKFELRDGDKPSGTASTRERCETRGHLNSNGAEFNFRKGDTIYGTWKSLWTSMPLASDSATEYTTLMQFKGYEPADGGPVVCLAISNKDNKLCVVNYTSGGSVVRIWERSWSSSMLNVWHNVGLGVKFDENSGTGWVEFWWDGAKQTLRNGQQRMSAATLYNADQIVKAKFGIYRPSEASGTAYHYIDTISLATAWPGWRS
jgi:hypothetical protein